LSLRCIQHLRNFAWGGFLFLQPLDPAESAGQDFPVPQHGVGQKGADLLNSFI
jgi:hypothetical protein